MEEIMKVGLFVHSVSGNTYLLAHQMETAFQDFGVDATLYRVADPDGQAIVDEFQLDQGLYDTYLALPEARADHLLACDHLVFASPTYFGNVSAEMKALFDATAIFWTDAMLAGKTCSALTTAGTAEGGPDEALQAILTFGQHMGMVSIAVPCNLIPGMDLTAYGLKHYTGADGSNRPGQDQKKQADAFAKWILRFHNK
jgi:NAD(P)H dehydrogenase (quinone)